MFDNQTPPLTPIESIGEFGLIERITSGFPVSENLIKGPGDDAAVYRLQDGRLLVSSTDVLAEGVHFDLSYTPLKHLGYKSVAVNLSDIFAMNARPFGILVSVCISNRFTVEAIEELYDGIRLACEKYQITLLGGDTTSSRSGLIISITALGFGDESTITYRSGASEKDLICVSGDLGAAYAGLQILEREKQVYLQNPEIQPALQSFEYCVGRLIKPEPRKNIIDLFEKLSVKPSSMIDISDGLANELHHICKQSNMGCVIYQDKLPIDYETVKVADEFQISPVTYAMNGGEDYELLFTVPVTDFEKLKSRAEISIIGHITSADRGIVMIGSSGQQMDIASSGFHHF